MDASKEIAEITETMAIYTAIATFGNDWNTASIDARAREIGYLAVDVLRRRENERNLYS